MISFEIFYDNLFLFAFLLGWIFVYICTIKTFRKCKSKARMNGKTVIVTGSNTGIGRATALNLSKRGAKVILACRNLERANTAKNFIEAKTANSNVVVKELDLSSMESVRQFAEDVYKSETRLDVLIHNAGIMLPQKLQTEEGLDMTLATNTFGPFLLTNLLIDLLKNTPKSRIVFVNSSAHHLGNIDPKMPNPSYESTSSKLKFNFNMYCMSKLASALIVKEMDRRLRGSGVTVNYLHPGFVASTILIKPPQMVMKLALVILPFLKNEEQGAQTTIYLAVSEEVEGVSGKYYVNCKEATPSKKVDNITMCQKFWEVCVDLVQMQPSDPRI